MIDFTNREFNICRKVIKLYYKKTMKQEVVAKEPYIPLRRRSE